ncbi:MAG TPA: hypothetical protein VMG99_00290 [Thermoplasmata archaeon]|nr:hypothetical protein [Thermoplasmata archaeon]
MPSFRPPSPASVREATRTVRELDRRLEAFDRAILIADWNLYVGRSRSGAAGWQRRRATLLRDEGLLAWLRAAKDRPLAPDDHRRVELLERVVQDALVEQAPDVIALRSAISKRIVAYRPRWHGRRVDRAVVTRALRESPDPRERERAYYALEPLYRPLEEPLRRLVRRRNARARALGYRHFAEMRLGFEGMTPERIAELGARATAPARPVLRALRDRFTDRFRAGWQPWDLLYARAVENPLPEHAFPRRGMLPRILAAVRRWGFRTERMRFRIVFHDVWSGGLTLAPDPPRDVRILVHPEGGWLAHMVLFHEVGHAVHSASIRAPRHLLRWHENVPGFGGLHEGIGGLFEELAGVPAWLTGRPGVSSAAAEAFAAAEREATLMWTAWTVAWFTVEQSLYANPDRDPRVGARRLERDLFGFGSAEPLSFVDPFFVDSPVYAPNYLLATLFHRQLRAAILDRFGPTLWPNPRVGPWLARTWFAAGSTDDWVPKVRAVTGRPFGAEAFVADYRSAGGSSARNR